MSRSTYHLTETALTHLEKVLRDTARRWDWRQAETYRDALLRGFQYIADHHKQLHSPHRNELTKVTDFCLHLVEHHYVAFKVHDRGDVIIVGLFFEGMNLPVRLKELQSLSLEEIAALQALIAAQKAKP
ncbi:type II toxin-antitoxin system RelE/ParE family toxin [bacterium]|nr:type II toxin-antitoxin system RelE/ParE family toxin [bacterium]